MNKAVKLLFVTLSIILLSLNLYSQDTETQKLRFAEAYEKSGDLKNAARIYQELYTANRSSDIYFNGLVRCLKAQYEYTKLLEVVENRLEIKKNPTIFTLYGEMLWRTGNSSAANEAWQRAIDLSPRSWDNYSLVAESQITVLQFDKAIATFEKARDVFNDPTLFSDQLSQLFIATGNYSRGTSEVLNYFERSKNLPLAQGRLSALMSGNDAIKHIQNTLRSKYGSNSENVLFLRLYSWFLRSVNDFDQAFEVYKKIDKLINARDSEVLNFANTSMNDGQYEIALKAYDYIIDKGKSNPYFTSALYGHTRTLEKQLLNDTKLSKESVKDIIKLYRKIIDEIPNSQLAADCKYRIAELALSQLNDKDLALEELTDITVQFKYLPISANAALMLGKIYTMQNKLDEARNMYENVLKIYGKSAIDKIDDAQYRLAELEYFRGNIDSSLKMFNEISANTDSDVSNDALEKVILISQNQSLTRAMSLFAKAELFELQGKISEAAELYDEISKLADGTDLAEKSVIRTAKIQYNLAHFNIAREALVAFLEKNPISLNADYVMLLIGNCLISEGNNDAAIKYFTDLITQFPRSIYLQEARTQIRRLRTQEKM